MIQFITAVLAALCGKLRLRTLASRSGRAELMAVAHPSVPPLLDAQADATMWTSAVKKRQTESTGSATPPW